MNTEPIKSESIKRLERAARAHPVTPTTELRRNWPCPCGSGKKLKKCCLAKAVAATKPRYTQIADTDGRTVERNGYPVYVRTP